MTDVAPARPAVRRRRRWALLAVPFVISALLHALPWASLVLLPGWPAGASAALSALVVVLAVGLPAALLLGHGRGVRWAVAAGDLWLGVVWQLFVWSAAGELVRLGLALAGLPDPARARVVAAAVLGWTVLLLAWGAFRALGPVPVREREIRVDGLGAGLDGLRIGQITDTHLGPFLSRRWTRRIVAQVNALDVDVLAHTGDLVDGSLATRAHQVEPLGEATARDARVFITGNHEYFSGAAEWTEYMASLGWTVLRNTHLVLTRGANQLVVAGIDDRTAARSGVPGHGADLDRALAGAPADVPVVLLAHQPRQVLGAVDRVDLQLSGHTHGGQLWPFHYLVRLDQPVLHGLSRHGDRTQLYTSRGTGFWGPPFRIFAPPEIAVLTLRPTEPG
ncbi:MAG TPA: metallophosphoesterase [Pseudonocardia sp.]|nr:metallophosphoesterase [Pseudonocardia sp.]